MSDRELRVALTSTRSALLIMAVQQAIAMGHGAGAMVRPRGSAEIATITESDVARFHAAKLAASPFKPPQSTRPAQPLRRIDDAGLEGLNASRADRARRNAKRLRDFDRQEAGKKQGT
jgi:hypothetical protein